MGSNNNQNKDLQDKQADLLDQTYTLGWMDGYAEGYDDAIEDTQNALNKLENENELLTEVVESKDNVIKELASSAGRAASSKEKQIKKGPFKGLAILFDHTSESYNVGDLFI